MVGGARRLHLADHGPDRRARRRQDRLHGGDRRRGEARQRLDRALRADRPRRPPARGRDRARGVDDPPDAGVDAGPGAGLRAGSPTAGRPRRRRRVLDAEPADDGGAAGRARGVDPRRLRRRRRPAAADRGRQAVRRPDRVRDRPGGAAQPDLPPGGALDDHDRGPRDQPGQVASPRAARRARSATSSSSTGPTPSVRSTPSSRSSPSARPSRYGVDPIRDVQVLAPMYRGAVGIDALNERLQAELNPDGRRALNDRFRVGDRLIQTRNSHDLGLMNGSIVFLREDDPEDEEIVVDTEDGPLRIPYGETGDAAARLRDLGPQGPGMRGPDRRRRLPPLARADADPARWSTPRSPAPAGPASWSATPARWRWRCAATRAAAATRAWPSACAARATHPAILPRMETPRPSPAAIAATLGGIVLLAAAGRRRSSRCAKRRRRRSAATPPRSAATSTASASPGRC